MHSMIIPKGNLTSGDNGFGIRAEGSNSKTIRAETQDTIDIVETDLICGNAY